MVLTRLAAPKEAAHAQRHRPSADAQDSILDGLVIGMKGIPLISAGDGAMSSQGRCAHGAT